MYIYVQHICMSVSEIILLKVYSGVYTVTMKNQNAFGRY